MSGPGALLELQLPPFDLEVVATRFQAFELDKHLAGAMLDVHRSRGRPERADPQNRQRNQHYSLAGSHLIFSATRSSALRARRLLSTSAATARLFRPTSLSRG